MLQCNEASLSNRARTRRLSVLETADRLFAEHGFHSTGVAQIAAESGVRIGQIYRDFASKEDIVAALAEQNVSGWLEEEVLAAAVAAGDAQAIRSWIRRFEQQDDKMDDCRLMTEIVAEAGRNARIAAIYHRIDDRVRDSLSLALRALLPDSADDGEVALLIEFILAAGIGVVSRRVLRADTPAIALGNLISKMVDRYLAHLSVEGCCGSPAAR
jgi:AcrR family transcriptional regulator